MIAVPDFNSHFHGEVVFQIDAGGRWTMLNDAWQLMTGRSAAEMLGEKFTDSIHPADLAGVQEVLVRVMSGQISETQIECRILSAKGDPRWAEVKIRAWCGGDDQRVAAAGSIQDTTARKLATDQIAGALRREQQLNQLRSEFITVASHELRTPLAGIMHSAETLKDYGEELTPEERLKYADIVLRGAKRIDALIDEVLILGKAQAGRLVFRPQNLPLRDFILRCAAELPIKNEHAARIRLEFSLPKVIYCMDGVLLRHTLVNLLTNALKYSPSDTPVFLGAFEEDETAVIFRIRDRGIGIPPNDMPHLFDPFHRGSNVGATKGSGVGLSITKACVECQGGTISCDSVLGSGTTFRVRLPYQPPGVRDIAAASAGVVFR